MKKKGRKEKERKIKEKLQKAKEIDIFSTFRNQYVKRTKRGFI